MGIILHGLRVLHGETARDAWEREFEPEVLPPEEVIPMTSPAPHEPMDDDDWIIELLGAVVPLYPEMAPVDRWGVPRALEGLLDDFPIRLAADGTRSAPCVLRIWSTTVSIEFCEAGAAFPGDPFLYLWRLCSALAGCGCALWEDDSQDWVDVNLALEDARRYWAWA